MKKLVCFFKKKSNSILLALILGEALASLYLLNCHLSDFDSRVVSEVSQVKETPERLASLVLASDSSK